jgi:hypothetical protein
VEVENIEMVVLHDCQSLQQYWGQTHALGQVLKEQTWKEDKAKIRHKVGIIPNKLKISVLNSFTSIFDNTFSTMQSSSSPSINPDLHPVPLFSALFGHRRNARRQRKQYI